MKTPIPRRRSARSGFTLVEVFTSVSILAVIVTGAVSLFKVVQNSWTTAFLHLRSSSEASRAITLPDQGRIVTQSGYVVADNVVTSDVSLANGGCNLSLTIREAGRRKQATTSMSTFVKFRN